VRVTEKNRDRVNGVGRPLGVGYRARPQIFLEFSSKKCRVLCIFVAKRIRGKGTVWKYSMAQLYGVSLAIWDHTVLPATRHK